jgi:OFA family oxalate/formate antiporter-like MFS transporter
MVKKIFYGWWVVLSCFFISFYMGGVVFYGFTAFFEPLVREFGWSYTQISLASSLRGLEMGIFSPIIGFLIDRFGSRKLILCGTSITGVGLILLSYSHSLVIFYSAFLLIAFGAGGCTSVVTMTVVGNWFRKKVGLAMGVMMSGFGVSGLVVPFIIKLIDAYDWRTTLIILGLGMWLLGIPLSYIIRNSPESYGYLPDGELSRGTVTHPEIQDSEIEIRLGKALKDKSFIYINIAEVIRMMITVAVATHVMPYLSSMGISRIHAGLVAAAIPLFSIAGRFAFGWLADVLDKKHVMAITFCFMSMGIVAFCFVHRVWAILLFLTLFPPGYGGSLVLRGAILRGYFGRESLGKMLGITMGSASIGGILGPTLTGWVFDTLGSYHFIWSVYSCFIVLAITLILRMR